ncbi:Lrp/AsnC family transcriptional regulator [Paracoccus fontiphilus]|uniref:Lrp/AsnC family transcriptional regulator n=1 Tax=Paracoccus fontiphilus TaxID=1815556 RepID=A0ABV7IE44_9RHOB|nr:Lrp/AsnC family transcriptional regulator [Paracoccus fontiphilus]
MDQIDLDILASLETDARLSFAELAERHAMSKTPVWKRVKAMEEAGAILGYSALLDAAALGFGVEAFVHVTLAPEAADRFEAAVVAHPGIRRCHATTGAGDYLLHIICRDIAMMDRMLRREIAHMPGVVRTDTIVSTRTVKSRHSLAGAAKAANRQTPA